MIWGTLHGVLVVFKSSGCFTMRICESLHFVNLSHELGNKLVSGIYARNGSILIKLSGIASNLR